MSKVEHDLSGVKPRLFSTVRGFQESRSEYRLLRGDCFDFLEALKAGGGQPKLIIASPPYNIGKVYERRLPLTDYIEWQSRLITLMSEVVANDGHICWQVGNYVDNGHIEPLDLWLHSPFVTAGFTLRNRIVWVYNHGPHCVRRFSGRYETLLWYTKSDRPDGYTFHLDAVRVPPKYPNKKHHKGPKKGQKSCNPLGKNPGDFWDNICSDLWDNIPNVKGQHIEKTEHPCQFPVGLVERCLLAMTDPKDLVVDPFVGSGSSGVAAALHGRRFAGCDKDAAYLETARRRIAGTLDGTVAHRPHHKPLYIPSASESRIEK